MAKNYAKVCFQLLKPHSDRRSAVRRERQGRERAEGSSLRPV